MEYAFTENGGHPTITLSGRFTYDDGTKFHRMISEWDFESNPSPILDCRYLTFLDSTGLGMLFLLARRCRDAGGRPVMEGAHAAVARTMRRAAMDTFIAVR